MPFNRYSYEGPMYTDIQRSFLLVGQPLAPEVWLQIENVRPLVLTVAVESHSVYARLRRTDLSVAPPLHKR